MNDTSDNDFIYGSLWRNEVEESLSEYFPGGFFSGLWGSVDRILEKIEDHEQDMEFLLYDYRFVLDACASLELVQSRLERKRDSLFPKLAAIARGELPGRPNKDEVAGAVIDTNPEYSRLVEEVDILGILLKYLSGDNYSKGGIKEVVRMRASFLQELSVRERQGIEDERLAD